MILVYGETGNFHLLETSRGCACVTGAGSQGCMGLPGPSMYTRLIDMQSLIPCLLQASRSLLRRVKTLTRLRNSCTWLPSRWLAVATTTPARLANSNGRHCLLHRFTPRGDAFSCAAFFVCDASQGLHLTRGTYMLITRYENSDSTHLRECCLAQTAMLAIACAEQNPVHRLTHPHLAISDPPPPSTHS